MHKYCPVIGPNLSEWLDNKKFFETVFEHEDMIKLKGFDAKQLDIYMTINYGERTMYEGWLSIDLHTIIDILINKYLDKWQNLVEVTKKDYLGGVLRITERDRKDNLTGKRDKKNTHKQGAFNTDDLIAESGDDSSDIYDDMRLVSATDIERKISIDNAFNSLHMLRRMDIVETVIRDFVSELTLSIYN